MPGKVLVLGATGRTGRLVVDAALERGWEVTAYVRSRGKLAQTHDRLRVVQGEVSDRDALAAALAGQDAVISTLGQQRGSPKDLLRVAADALVAAMRAAGVERVIVLSGVLVKVAGDPPSPFVQRLGVCVARVVLPWLIDDTQLYADRIRASDLVWTVVRPPRLTNGPGGRPLQAAPTLALRMSSSMDRRDLADFLVDQLESATFVRRSPMVATAVA